MKHVLFGLISLFVLLCGCTSAPTRQSQSQSNVSYDTQSVSLDSAILESSKYCVSRIDLNSTIAIVNIQSPTINMTNYIIDSMLMHLVNEDKYLIIERSELDVLENEQNYQLSGMVSDESAVSIGKQLGTQFIITGSMLPLGDKYSLRFKIINVETAQIIGTRMYTVRSDNVLLSLINPPINKQEENVTQVREVPQQVIMGDVNITNNTTTTIQGDVYVNMPNGLGW